MAEYGRQVLQYALLSRLFTVTAFPPRSCHSHLIGQRGRILARSILPPAEEAASVRNQHLRVASNAIVQAWKCLVVRHHWRHLGMVLLGAKVSQSGRQAWDPKSPTLWLLRNAIESVQWDAPASRTICSMDNVLQPWHEPLVASGSCGFDGPQSAAQS